MIKNAVLHIGGEKTGTTTLQRFMTRNAAALKRAGYYYPCERNNICFENFGHFPVAGCVIDGDAVEFVSEKRRRTFSSVLDVLTKRCNAANSALLLSCEHFSSRLTRREQLEALRNTLPVDDIKIVFYAREPSELALASWSTSVRSGGRREFAVDEVLPTNRYFAHVKVLDLWADVFGRESLIVREYDRSRLANGDIREDFCQLLGVKLEHSLFEEDQNRSLDLQRLEVLRHINCSLPLHFECESGWRKAQSIRQLIAECVPEGIPLEALMSKRDAATIKARFGEVNRELSERYFNGQLSRKWFEYDAEDGNHADASRAENVDLASALRETIIRIAEMAHDYESRSPKRRLRKRMQKAAAVMRQLGHRLLPRASRLSAHR